MIKSRQPHNTTSVTFTVDPRQGAQAAAVCGEWNSWSQHTDVMRPDPSGGLSVTVELQRGRRYRFRYLLDGQRWDNDWAADAYVPNGFGSDDSVVDLTALDDSPPPAADPPAAKKAAAPARKSGSPAKKAAAASKGTGAEDARVKDPGANDSANKGSGAKARKTAAPAKKAAPWTKRASGKGESTGADDAGI